LIGFFKKIKKNLSLKFLTIILKKNIPPKIKDYLKKVIFKFRRKLRKFEQFEGLAKRLDGKKNILIIDYMTPTPDKDSGSVDAVFMMEALIDLGFNVIFIPDNLIYVPNYTDNLVKKGVVCINNFSIDSFLKEHGNSLSYIFLSRVHTARQFINSVKKMAPSAKLIFNSVDLHFVRELRYAEITGDKKDFEVAQYTKLEELNLVKLADATMVLSLAEVQILANEGFVKSVYLTPFMRNIPGAKKSFEERENILFIGSFLHKPNIDAINYFLKEIWPLVRIKKPNLEINVIGSNISNYITKFDNKNLGINIIGFVEDLTQYFESSILSVAPMRYGAGIKGKIATSASFGVPCVASSLAAEGMCFTDGVNILIADQPTLFAEHIFTLCNDKNKWNELSINSIAFMEARYSYNAGKKRLRNLLESLKKNYE
jgi:glycosyltransferase involved in cell wall biosynthesis